MPSLRLAAPLNAPEWAMPRVPEYSLAKAAKLHTPHRKTKKTDLREGRMSRDGLSHNQPVNIIGPFVGFHRLKITHVPAHRKIIGRAVCPQQIPRLSGNF